MGNIKIGNGSIRQDGGKINMKHVKLEKTAFIQTGGESDLENIETDSPVLMMGGWMRAKNIQIFLKEKIINAPKIIWRHKLISMVTLIFTLLVSDYYIAWSNLIRIKNLF